MNYSEIRMYKNGKVKILDLGELEYKPVWMNQFGLSFSQKTKVEFNFTLCKTSQLEKRKQWLFKKIVKEAEKDLKPLQKKYDKVVKMIADYNETR